MVVAAFTTKDVQHKPRCFLQSHFVRQVGHNLGLGHHGLDALPNDDDSTQRDEEEYYRGEHNSSNPLSWGPIMGKLQHELRMILRAHPRFMYS